MGKSKSFEGVRRLEAAAIVSDALASGGGWLGPSETHRLLDCYGVEVARSALVGSPEEAAKAAMNIGGKVALKATAPGVVHKSDLGAGRVGLDPSQVRKAAEQMTRIPKLRGPGGMEFVVQEMVDDGAEMLVGMTNDPSFGPLLVCGAGGRLVELIKDVSVKLTPLTDVDAREMVRSLKTYQVLRGYRGGVRRDVSALEETILRIGEMVEDTPEIAELDLNPVFVLEEGKGAVVADARIRVAESGGKLPLGTRKR